ncbi:M48 family metallopeptidase [Aquimarina sp. 2201CG14-23]|uniref:M48 family metallopeptidase n=1 Tax=Aquimarina mycalae TaxID=3040073 RepID=UPI002477E878|nr:M48 family metallopeptidase [Aquimarina sp. 2201CG14-23]MDH7444992.1 M48 family metallopeptidase [Aquimarina sp. 2201CG14-23]
MENLYKKITVDIPEHLTKPSLSFKKHTWLAMAGLILFVISYIALSWWFGYTAYRLFSDSLTGGKDAFMNFLIGIPNLFLFIFMIKALFFIKRGGDPNQQQITEKDEPILFNYLYQLADEAGAPRPHKVFLSSRVNASVSYDLSVLNFFFPSKKNLEIGIGLINVLNLGEFKAVLAHEFGHFAQRSMLVGRWVYMSHQIAAHIIGRRDALDNILQTISYLDLRIAWIGWILSIIVWSIRAVIEIFFKIVVIAHRALSREMEFHADLIAVSLTGSDALIHALHRLQAADDAYDKSLNMVHLALNKEKAVVDMFALQTNAIERMAFILNEKDYGASPEVPLKNPEENRIFTSKLANPPKMWATHPADHDRENNAKKVYIKAAIDNRSAWELFSNPEETKKNITAALIETANIKTTPLPTEESIIDQNKIFDKVYYHPKYRGVYLDREFLRYYENPNDIYLQNSTFSDLKKEINALYPESLNEDLEILKTINEEQVMLTALKEKILTAPGGVIMYRGEQINRKDLPEVIQNVERELTEAQEKIQSHDKLSRSVSLKAAKQIGNGWDQYLNNLVNIIHYSEHNRANVEDSENVLYNVLNVVMADGRVTSSELDRLLRVANDLHGVLQKVYSNTNSIKLSKEFLDKLETKNWEEFIGKFDLVHADKDNINEWMKVIESWINTAKSSLFTLRSLALESLLKGEEYVNNLVLLDEISNDSAPSLSTLPEKYNLLKPGMERPIQKKLGWWDRFQTSDGIIPSIAKLAVAGVIVGATVFAGSYVGTSSLAIYNGLAKDVIVQVNDKEIELSPYSSEKIELTILEDLNIRTTSLDNGTEIETFSPETESTSKTYVYNIANAAALVKWTAFYGGQSYNNDKRLGASRWSITNADYVLEQPPNTVSTSGGSTTRDVLEAYSNYDPVSLINMVSSEDEINAMISSHAIWDSRESVHIMTWLAVAQKLDNFDTILEERLQKNPDDPMLLRMQQEGAEGEEKEKICANHSDLAVSNPNNANYYYLKTRCLQEGSIQNDAFKSGYKKWPDNPWLAFASGYIYAAEENWEMAEKSMKTAITKEPALSYYISMDLKRIQNMLGRDTKNSFKRNFQVDYLDYVEKLEKASFDIKSSPDYAYSLLNKGQLKEAINHTRNDKLQDFIIRYAAASDGADQSIIESALSLGIEKGINAYTIWSALGLAVRENKDIALYRSKIKEFYPEDENKIFEFIDLVKSNNLKVAKQKLGDIRPLELGSFYSLGTIILKDKAPKQWRANAKGLLFLNEGPYFK